MPPAEGTDGPNVVPARGQDALDAYAKKAGRADILMSAVLVTAAISYAFLLGSGWSWPLFLWGPGAAVVSVACIRGLMRLMYHVVPSSAAERERAKARGTLWYRGVYPAFVATGG